MKFNDVMKSFYLIYLFISILNFWKGTNGNCKEDYAYITILPYDNFNSYSDYVFKDEQNSAEIINKKLIVLSSALVNNNCKYPLIVLTRKKLYDDPSFKNIFSLLAEKRNVIFMDINERFLAHTIKQLKQKDRLLFCLWIISQYKKLLYIDLSLFPRKCLDPIFQESPKYGIGLVNNQPDTSLMLIEPSLNNFNGMISFAKSKDGSNKSAESIIFKYFNVGKNDLFNPSLITKTSICDNSIWKDYQKLGYFWSFDSTLKPWNFLTTNDSNWPKQFNELALYQWSNTLFESMNQLKIFKNDEKIIKSNFRDKKWVNFDRQKTICENYLKNRKILPKDLIKDRFSIIIGTVNRYQLLLKTIENLLSSTELVKYIDKVFIICHKKSSPPPQNFIDYVHKMKVPSRIIYSEWDSLNTRFNPLPDLRTEATLLIDDDILIAPETCLFAYNVWKRTKKSIVGFFPRLFKHNFEDISVLGKKNQNSLIFKKSKCGISQKNHQPEWNYIIGNDKFLFSAVLTKFMFINTNYLFLYTCCMKPLIHKYVDFGLNCEDIAMNLLASGVSGIVPQVVHGIALDYGTKSGISSKAGHLDYRSLCIGCLLKLENFALPRKNNITHHLIDQ